MKIKRILMVEDEDGIREAVAKMVSEYVDVVDQASNGKEGLDLATRHTYDCIVSDIRMPVMTGIDFLKNLRAQKIQTPFILFTAFDDRNYMVESLKYGAFAFIQKPNYEELEKVLEKVNSMLIDDQTTDFEDLIKKKLK